MIIYATDHEINVYCLVQTHLFACRWNFHRASSSFLGSTKYIKDVFDFCYGYRSINPMTSFKIRGE